MTKKGLHGFSNKVNQKSNRLWRAQAFARLKYLLALRAVMDNANTKTEKEVTKGKGEFAIKVIQMVGPYDWHLGMIDDEIEKLVCTGKLHNEVEVPNVAVQEE